MLCRLYGRQYFTRHKIPVARSFLYTAQNPTMQRAREISEILLELFDKGRVQKIFVIYTDMKNGMTEETKTERLLPFHRKVFASNQTEKQVKTPFEFMPPCHRDLLKLKTTRYLCLLTAPSVPKTLTH